MKIQNGDEVRDATREEEAFIRETQIGAQAAQQAVDERREQREAILARLGLTADEIALILGGV